MLVLVLEAIDLGLSLDVHVASFLGKWIADEDRYYKKLVNLANSDRQPTKTTQERKQPSLRDQLKNRSASEKRVKNPFNRKCEANQIKPKLRTAQSHR